MKSIIPILFLFLSIIARGQASDSTGRGKLDLGLTFSPDYSYRSLKTDAADRWMQDIYDTLETYRYSYTAGLNIIFHITEKFSIGSGLLLADKGEKTKKYAVQPINNYTNHYYYIDVPLKANYYLLDKKVKLLVTLGCSANIYMNSQTDVGASGSSGSNENQPLKLNSQISRLNFSFIGGLGMDCPITNRWYFRLEPNYRRSITPVASSPVKKYFYSAGVNIGLFYKL